ncbi:MAG: DUF3486 family protein [Candidatus Binatus sp.]|uniref:phage protein Gp27 family protein n=1 Tax=Candidatus Binatus sp. TaxID=2811406 RepID=UPI002728B5A6|nr:phage protein Gp27 family protein [Candidatus Binatus sp.]MDO8432054.1 DUF3486 family protein [Candidatus Binatus sp.]
MEEKKAAPAVEESARSERIPFKPTLKHRTWKIAGLPDDLRAELDRQLGNNTFQSSRALSKWLGENGYEISHAAIHKYGQKFERRLAAVRIASEQARIVCDQFKNDDDEAMQNALMRLVQSQLFQVLVAVNETAKRTPQGRVADVIPVNLTALARSVAGLLRVDAERRRWSERTRARIEQAAETIEAAKSEGLSENVASRIRGVLMAIEE